MKKLQQGFTLIELMIVVAIIGILAAIAVPAYQDYTIRSRVSEAASLSGAVRTAIDVAFSEGFDLGSIPTTPESLNISASTSYKSKYVSKVAYTANGTITVTLKNTVNELGTAKGGTVIYGPTNQGGNLSWTVTGSVPTKYRPKN
ncbi:fimbrial protein [Sulfuricaulis limicola]|uniref:Fimbrial protein n=1 Tax=Sulfuricaulis limicola TaxID=1620215 RepID=A0A1B4XEK6_9GAMM|nr:pilin [Sulfuricaulis limicola]BAV33226.1 fimbrial protein [Sulfuricaulis limicola]